MWRRQHSDPPAVPRQGLRPRYLYCVFSSYSRLHNAQMLYDNEEVQASDLLDVAEATGDDPLVSTRIELQDHCNYKYLLHLQGAQIFPA